MTSRELAVAKEAALKSLFIKHGIEFNPSLMNDLRDFLYYERMGNAEQLFPLFSTAEIAEMLETRESFCKENGLNPAVFTK